MVTWFWTDVGGVIVEAEEFKGGPDLRQSLQSDDLDYDVRFSEMI